MFIQIDTVRATGRNSQYNGNKHFITVGINFCEENGFNEVTPYELSNTDTTVVLITYKLEHIKAIKKLTECSVDINQMGTNNI